MEIGRNMKEKKKGRKEDRKKEERREGGSKGRRKGKERKEEGEKRERLCQVGRKILFTHSGCLLWEAGSTCFWQWRVHPAAFKQSFWGVLKDPPPGRCLSQSLGQGAGWGVGEAEKTNTLNVFGVQVGGARSVFCLVESLPPARSPQCLRRPELRPWVEGESVRCLYSWKQDEKPQAPSHTPLGPEVHGVVHSTHKHSTWGSSGQGVRGRDVSGKNNGISVRRQASRSLPQAALIITPTL